MIADPFIQFSDPSVKQLRNELIVRTICSRKLCRRAEKMIRNFAIRSYWQLGMDGEKIQRPFRGICQLS